MSGRNNILVCRINYVTSGREAELNSLSAVFDIKYGKLLWLWTKTES